MGNNYNTTKLITKVVMLKGEKGEKGSIDNLPTASPTTKGGIKVGSGLAMNGELLECDVNFDDYYTKAQAQQKLISGSNIKMINNKNILGGGSFNLMSSTLSFNSQSDSNQWLSGSYTLQGGNVINLSTFNGNLTNTSASLIEDGWSWRPTGQNQNNSSHTYSNHIGKYGCGFELHYWYVGNGANVNHCIALNGATIVNGNNKYWDTCRVGCWAGQLYLAVTNSDNTYRFYSIYTTIDVMDVSQ